MVNVLLSLQILLIKTCFMYMYNISSDVIWDISVLTKHKSIFSLLVLWPDDCWTLQSKLLARKIFTSSLFGVKGNWINIYFWQAREVNCHIHATDVSTQRMSPFTNCMGITAVLYLYVLNHEPRDVQPVLCHPVTTQNTQFRFRSFNLYCFTYCYTLSLVNERKTNSLFIKLSLWRTGKKTPLRCSRVLGKMSV
jgi:hypothetical protein